MGAAGRTGRGERARVAARVRALVGTPEPDPTDAEPTRAWVPGMRPPARHGTEAGGRARLRWDPGRRGVAALGLAVVVVLAATGWWLAAGRPTSMPLDSSGSQPATALSAVSAPVSAPVSASVSASAPVISSPVVTPTSPAVVSPAGSSSGGSVVVDVAGKVRHPGVYTLPAGARVYDAVRAAGGARPGASTLALNLAAPLQDGEQILVGVPGGIVAGGTSPGVTSGAAGSSTAAAPVNLNTATLEELEALPGVGPVLGQNILDWRAAHQQFTSVDQLTDVSGIGDVRLAQLRPLVTI